MAKVSHNDIWSVGSSIAVSTFLRPLCLYRRIVNFKQSLKNAIVFYQSLNTADKMNWSSNAFDTGGFGRTKAPCQNCAWMFLDLEGFNANNDPSNGDDTFLGACAEYCPVNQLLADDVETTLSENDAQFMHALIKRNKDRCSVLFEQFGTIAEKCTAAKNSKDVDKMKRVFREIKHQIHIFGLKPMCNHHF